MKFSFLEQKMMYESDYAKKYPATQLRKTIKIIDEAYLKFIGYISGDLPCIIKKDVVLNMIKYIKQQHDDLPSYEKPHVKIYVKTIRLDAMYMNWDITVYFRHIGVIKCINKTLVIPIGNNDLFTNLKIL